MGNNTPIKFGTDGWRGLIADDFTFENVRKAAAAIAGYLHNTSEPQESPVKGVCIGYDTRFGSDRFARAVAEVLAASGIPVKLANRHHAHARPVLWRPRTRRRGRQS